MFFFLKQPTAFPHQGSDRCENILEHLRKTSAAPAEAECNHKHVQPRRPFLAKRLRFITQKSAAAWREEDEWGSNTGF